VVRSTNGTSARTINVILPCPHYWVPIFNYPAAGEDYGDQVVARYCLDCGAWLPTRTEGEG